MSSIARHLQEQVAALFGLAEDAFDKGKVQLGEELTALALRYLDEADAPERSPSQAPAEPQRPVTQQQQQAQPEGNDKE
jgi:hypothetical protein